MSLDGLIEGPNGEYDWCLTDQDYGQSEFLKRIDSIFIGRKTYELTLAMGGFEASGLPKLKVYIFSTTLESVEEGSILIKGNLKSEVEKIKNEAGKDIWLSGGASLTTSLMNLGLIDELSLAVHPLLLSKGKPLFNNLDGLISLELLNTKAYSTGLVSLSYKIRQGI